MPPCPSCRPILPEVSPHPGSPMVAAVKNPRRFGIDAEKTAPPGAVVVLSIASVESVLLFMKNPPQLLSAVPRTPANKPEVDAPVSPHTPADPPWADPVVLVPFPAPKIPVFGADPCTP